MKAGDIDSAKELLRNRIVDIDRLGGDPSDTMGQLQRIESGDIEGAMLEASILDNRAVDEGFLTASSTKCGVSMSMSATHTGKTSSVPKSVSLRVYFSAFVSFLQADSLKS